MSDVVLNGSEDNSWDEDEGGGNTRWAVLDRIVQTRPGSTLDLIKHLSEEVVELAHEYGTGELTNTYHPSGKVTGVPSELADCMILVAAIAQRLGVDLETAVKDKWERVRK